MEHSGHPPSIYSNPGEASLTPDKKRKRLATVCLPCRSRKLKCDKELPACSRCIKSGKPEQCSYEEATLRELRPGESTTPRSSSTAGGVVVIRDAPHTLKPPSVATELYGNYEDIRKNRVLEDRIQLLERLVMQQSQGGPAPSPYSSQPSISARLPEPALVTSSLVADFHDFRALTKELRNQNPLLGRVIRELNSLKNIKPAKSLSPDIIVDKSFLLKLLPSREVIDSLVDLYLETVEPIYRLNYLPAFRQQLSELYENSIAVSPETIVRLLLMMATIWPLKYGDQPLSKWRKELLDEDPLAFSHDTFNHLKAGYWILCCDDWIRKNKMSHPDITTICLLAHLSIAKDANRIRYKHEWLSNTYIVKMAMSLGFNRDPEPSAVYVPGTKKQSRAPHVRELRRRVWAAVVELDLKASMEKGMTPTARETDFDSVGPSNLNDDELGDGIEVLPQSHAATQATDNSLQSSLFRSLHLRLRACNLIYSPRFSTTYLELTQLESDLTRALEDIPAWEEPHTGATKTDFRQQTRMWRAVLKYKIRHCMLSLQNRLMLLGSKQGVLPTSSQARVDLAADILLHHMTTSECFRQLTVLAPLDCYAQAALTLCHHLYTTRTGFGSAMGREMVPEMTESLLSVAEKLLNEFEAKAILTGKGHKEFLLIATVITLTRIKWKPEEQTTYKQRLVDRLTTLGYRMLGRLNPEDATTSVQQSLIDEPGQTPVSMASGGVEHLPPEYAQWDNSFIPNPDNTPSDLSWDFMVGDWASTEFFSI